MEEQTEVTGGSGAVGKMEESKANWEPERQRNMPLLFFVTENSFCFEEVAALSSAPGCLYIYHPTHHKMYRHLRGNSEQKD